MVTYDEEIRRIKRKQTREHNVQIGLIFSVLSLAVALALLYYDAGRQHDVNLAQDRVLVELGRSLSQVCRHVPDPQAVSDDARRNCELAERGELPRPVVAGNVIGPTGPRGERGVPGPEGPRGPVGPPGTDGAAGTNGTENSTAREPQRSRDNECFSAEERERYIFTDGRVGSRCVVPQDASGNETSSAPNVPASSSTSIEPSPTP